MSGHPSEQSLNQESVHLTKGLTDHIGGHSKPRKVQGIEDWMMSTPRGGPVALTAPGWERDADTARLESSERIGREVTVFGQKKFAQHLSYTEDPKLPKRNGATRDPLFSELANGDMVTVQPNVHRHRILFNSKEESQ